MTTLAISYLLLKKYFKKDFRSQTWRRFPFDILGKVSIKVLIDETSRAHLHICTSAQRGRSKIRSSLETLQLSNQGDFLVNGTF